MLLFLFAERGLVLFLEVFLNSLLYLDLNLLKLCSVFCLHPFSLFFCGLLKSFLEGGFPLLEFKVGTCNFLLKVEDILAILVDGSVQGCDFFL